MKHQSYNVAFAIQRKAVSPLYMFPKQSLNMCDTCIIFSRYV